ncbi:30S ribosomal protein S7 [candidate division KSB1 bacterium RBG_16_48_16]|nr:MAG: 30S ribosomal protein S7 [candidate division KSB1 bacterium RBG_16_48_16]
MPRRKRAIRRQILPDPKFHKQVVTRFVNSLMNDGKKSVAEQLFYESIDIVAEKAGKDGIEVFEAALGNVKPILEVKSRRVGGATYQVPVEVRPKRQEALAIRWLITYARSRSDKTMALKLANEFLSASKGEGASIKKREDTHKMAEANRAFAHFKW